MVCVWCMKLGGAEVLGDWLVQVTSGSVYGGG